MSAEAWFAKGMEYADDGEWKEAVKYFTQAVKLASDWIIAWETLASCFENLHDDENGIRCFDAILALDSNHVYTWGRKGRSLANLGRRVEAIECFSKAIGLYKPEMADNLPPAFISTLWSLRASSYAIMKLYNEAISDFNEALALDRENATNWLQRGICFALLGKHSEAVASFDKALGIDPKNQEALERKKLSVSHLKM